MPSLTLLIKDINIKSLVSGDAEVDIRLRGRLDKNAFIELLQIYDAQKEVVVDVRSSES